MSMKYKNIIGALAVSLVYMLILWTMVPFVYGIVDDRSMMEIMSGQYLGTPDVHGFFIGHWYALLVTGLYRVLPNVDWYALCYPICCGISKNYSRKCGDSHANSQNCYNEFFN